MLSEDPRRKPLEKTATNLGPLPWVRPVSSTPIYTSELSTQAPHLIFPCYAIATQMFTFTSRFQSGFLVSIHHTHSIACKQAARAEHGVMWSWWEACLARISSFCTRCRLLGRLQDARKEEQSAVIQIKESTMAKPASKSRGHSLQAKHRLKVTLGLVYKRGSWP